MINHVWGLLSRPNREWAQINTEGETVTHLYAHHVLLMALIPVVCAFIGTTQIGWKLGDMQTSEVSLPVAIALGAGFYLAILAAIAVMGNVIFRMAERYPDRPNVERCIVFAGYVATPLFLAGAVLLYPLIWLCILVGCVAFCYTAYLLYLGIPAFLQIPRKDGFILSSGTLGIGVLVLEALLALTVLIWSVGSNFGIGRLFVG
ncbi:Yip1 family protein [Pseudomonas sp.]|jgi:hypothetical protein|uniref:Yip1 family protein n=1 Tax=Pseudomonas sp. TaxID=306 RepID=UPI0028A9DF4C|nr:Yip1 family protein [Pseudomonas sp.]